MSYLVILEKAENNWSAYVPDLPGCVATGRTRIQAFTNAKTAIKMHIQGMKEDGLPIPRPSTKASYVSPKKERLLPGIVARPTPTPHTSGNKAGVK